MNEQRLKVAMACAQSATRLALAHFNNRDALNITAKGAQDLVSRADVEVEQLLRAGLSAEFPGEAILGEEMGGEVITDGWVLDPIDGTGNFLRGSPLWGIAIAYMSDSKPVVGVIAYPVLGFTLAATRGGGVLLNGEPFQRPKPPQHLRIIGVGENNRRSPEELGQLELMLRREGWGLSGYRCATIGLGFAALGHTDGYVEQFTNLWDIAAGAVICREAGLLCKVHGEHKPYAMSVVAGDETLMMLIDW
jgi:myo-inositol-1(or 4)-monophosphatase